MLREPGAILVPQAAGKDDEFAVALSWRLTGAATPVVGGYWIVKLYSANVDRQGTMTGLLGSATIPITGGGTPLPFQYRFKVSPPVPQPGVYQLTATINHSPVQNPAEFDEMFGFAESTPIQITDPDAALDIN